MDPENDTNQEERLKRLERDVSDLKACLEHFGNAIRTMNAETPVVRYRSVDELKAERRGKRAKSK